MGEAYFYHLTRRPLEVTLSQLVAKSLEQGWRVVIKGNDRGRLEWLDEKLWLLGDESFLPHGLSGGAHDAIQPVLLTTDEVVDVDCVMCIDGADVSAKLLNSTQRACILFDGNDEAAVQTARQQWKTLTEEKCAAQYWSEETGRWEKKAESKS